MKCIPVIIALMCTLSVTAQTDLEYMQSAQQKIGLGDFKGAIQDFDNAISECRKGSQIDVAYIGSIYYSRAIAKDMSKDFNGAIDDYTRAIELKNIKNIEVAYESRGTCRRYLKDNKGAIEDYNKAIEINPTFIKAFYNRGIANMGLQNYQEAIYDFTKTIELDINNDDAYITRSIAKSHLNNFTGAIEDINKAIVINPGNEKARNLLKETTELKHTAEALQSLKEPVKKSPPATANTNQVSSIADIKDNSMPAIGTMAPDFTQADVNGKPVSLSAFKGKYVLIQFWASWSDPCIKESPYLVQGYNSYNIINKRKFEIIGISLDGAAQKENWKKSLQDQHLTWTQLCDFKGWNNEVAKIYHITSVPMNFLLDPDGKIIKTNLRGDILNLTLATLVVVNKDF